MSQLSHFETKVLQALGLGQTSLAQDLLLSWKKNDTGSDPRLLFIQSKVCLYEGSYLQALSFLMSYLQQRPLDLIARCDLILCFYQLGEKIKFERELELALNLFQQNITSLSNKDELDAAIFLTKMLEEKADPLKALDLLSLPLDSEITSKQRQALKIQKLRVLIELQDEKKARPLYEEILQGLDHNLNFEIEREHTLMLADAFLMGFNQAFERYQYATKQNITQVDLEFLTSELAEQMILKKQWDKLPLLKMNSNSESVYEKEQALLIESFLSKQNLAPFTILRWEKSLAPLLTLRLIRQTLLLFSDSIQKEEWQIRYRFHCMSLKSKALQESFLQILYENEPFETLKIDAGRKKILQQDRELDLKSPLFWKLLELFSEGDQELDLMSAVEKIYDEPLNDQHFDRLRVALYRLNSSLEKMGYHKSIFQLTKSKVKFLARIEEKTV